MNIGVIGGGAIGLLLSGYLAEEHNVTVYVRRTKQKLLIDLHGVRISDKFDRRQVQCELIHNIKDQDCIMVCVKQFQFLEILPHLSSLGNEVLLVFLQNGMSHIEKISNLSQPISIGTVEHGAEKVNDYTVKHTGEGVIKLASYSRVANNELQQLLSELEQHDFPMVYRDNWSILLKEKLILNAVINPLTALFQVKNSQVIQNEYIRFLAKQLCEEASFILNLNEDKQWSEVQRVAKNTGENTSSMYKDIKERRKTEIEAISGYLLKQCSNTKIPYTSFVYHSLKALEKKKGILNK
ncbi:2-dehydropantoate 2-reductase [Virgibacillus halodenitrificans]|uniref:2-dehydropantoate 2-reductase n=1 Tax=Virgibacillus halodenitrificans TaxID=1482 RepID=A0ABR7VRV6_VIRHA|nr:2-dehydropantoate 2-reductase [Virgibacillus halodenitrificans]MBD1224620.1 2-dehydropantoate 2-reductase [Virgibacillus halodenitrificans]MCJ0931305.1 2-dehydropantoate 2-reductase [Virgibacillus halodenitrificans]CDQ35947.1 putative 2-dehydropantoate 2-reductase [Virgibacillus halodenitrificans]